MTQFKGTKGKWEQTLKYERIIVGNNICDVWGFDAMLDKQKEIEMKANAQLISKAPEMLEMLVKCKDYFKSKEQAYYKIIEQLIEEATKTH